MLPAGAPRSEGRGGRDERNPFSGPPLRREGREWRAACNGSGGREAMRETESSLQRFGGHPIARRAPSPGPSPPRSRASRRRNLSRRPPHFLTRLCQNLRGDVLVLVEDHRAAEALDRVPVVGPDLQGTRHRAPFDQGVVDLGLLAFDRLVAFGRVSRGRSCSGRLALPEPSLEVHQSRLLPGLRERQVRSRYPTDSAGRRAQPDRRCREPMTRDHTCPPGPHTDRSLAYPLERPGGQVPLLAAEARPRAGRLVVGSRLAREGSPRVVERECRCRWVICSLLFLATTVNYIDRQILALVKAFLGR